MGIRPPDGRGGPGPAEGKKGSDRRIRPGRTLPPPDDAGDAGEPAARLQEGRGRDRGERQRDLRRGGGPGGDLAPGGEGTRAEAGGPDPGLGTGGGAAGGPGGGGG